MTTSRLTRALLGGATLSPFAPLLITVVYGLVCALLGVQAPAMVVLAPLVMVASLMVLFAMAFYTIHALRNELLTSDGRILWLLMILKLGVIAMPLYWYRYIWRARPDYGPMFPTEPSDATPSRAQIEQGQPAEVHAR